MITLKKRYCSKVPLMSVVCRIQEKIIVVLSVQIYKRQIKGRNENAHW